MNKQAQNKLIGLLCIIMGIVTVLFVAFDFLWRIVVVLFAIGLVNYGLSLRGLPSIQFTLRAWLNMLRF